MFMKLKFHTETKIIFAVLVLIIIAAVIFIALNYRKLKQPNPVSQNLAVHAQVKAASVPIRPRGN
jgi:hypothetical protein